VLAVGAALIVGLRQAKIMRQQVVDTQKQNEATLFIQEQSLRADLLALRSDCINELRPLWSAHFTKGNLNLEEISQLKPVLWKSQVLFSRQISERIATVIHSQLLGTHRLNTAHSYFQQGDEETAQHWNNRAFEAEDDIIKALQNLLEDMVEEARMADWPKARLK